MTDIQVELRDAARRFGLSEGAANAIFDALRAGGGRQAQFSHPDLGGMGQWSGGMTQVGDMFNNDLKARVTGFCEAVAPLAEQQSSSGIVPPAGQWQHQTSGPEGGSSSAWAQGSSWWPDHLGGAASSGSQNGMRYACFPDQHRLAIERDGAVTLYDTGEHRLTGFSQQQSVGSDLSFSGQSGPVRLDQLRVVER